MAGEIVLLAVIASAFALTGIYLIYVRRLMRTMEFWLPEFWQSMGSPRHFTVQTFVSLVSVLYTTEMTARFREVNSRAELMVVRILLPLCSLLNCGLIVFIVLYSGH